MWGHFQSLVVLQHRLLAATCEFHEATAGPVDCLLSHSTSDGFQPTGDGLQPTSYGLQPNSASVQEANSHVVLRMQPQDVSGP